MKVFRFKMKPYCRRYCWLMILISAVFLNEWFSYRWCRFWHWPNPKVLSSEKDSVNLLIVADPQIQGYQGESPTFGAITRWDSDRYLSTGFNLAYNYVQPDAVVILGDLIDEGSSASDEDYLIYVNRFKSIFERDEKWIIIPGDGDVGGEKFDIQTEEKINRYTKYFGSWTGVESVKFVNIVKMNRYRSVYFKQQNDAFPWFDSTKKNNVTLLINHENLLTSSQAFYASIFKTFQPDLVLTGDSHLAFAMECRKCWAPDGSVADQLNTIDQSQDMSELRLKLPIYSPKDDRNIIEISVPTCSYRMGVPKMAYGMLQISRRGSAYYANLWLPNRFLALTIYIASLVLSFIVALVTRFYSKR